MKGYKAFNRDWTCLGKQYKEGQTYTEEGAPVICEHGMHFCPKLLEVFRYYDYDKTKTVVAEVESVGETVQGEYKYCTNKLRIIKRVSWKKIHRLMAEEMMRLKHCLWRCFAEMALYGLYLAVFQKITILSLFGTITSFALMSYWTQWIYLSILKNYTRHDYNIITKVFKVLIPTILIYGIFICMMILQVYYLYKILPHPY